MHCRNGRSEAGRGVKVAVHHNTILYGGNVHHRSVAAVDFSLHCN